METVIGTPKANTALEAGDLILTYGRHECLGRLRNRPAESDGDLERVRSVEEQKELQVSELAAEEELAKPPLCPQRRTRLRIDPLQPPEGGFPPRPVVFLSAPDGPQSHYTHIMSEYSALSYTVKPVEGDAQVEIVIHASDGNKWEYGVPYSTTTGRYTFEEIDVIAMDFGDDFAEELSAKLDEVMEELIA